MVPEFKILIHRNSDNLHLKLVGDFDGSSAQELISTIKRHGLGAYTIFIHTSGLRQIFSSGRAVFRTNLSSLNNRFFGNLIYTGECAPEIAPESSQIV